MASVQELMDLTGRVGLVVGGAGHLGGVAAEALADLGAQVALADLDEDGARGRAGQLATGDTSHFAFGVDLTVAAAATRLVEDVVAAAGRLDVVVLTAAYVGSTPLKGWAVPFEEQDPDTWRASLRINLDPVLPLTQAAAPHLRVHGVGSIVLFSSIYGLVGPDLRLYDGTGMGNPAAYAAAKGGIVQLTRWLATALAPAVRVNSVSPGGVARGQPEHFVERYCERTPLRRMADDEDVKGAVAYLASDASAYVTAHNLVVDGGWTAW